MTTGTVTVRSPAIVLFGTEQSSVDTELGPLVNHVPEVAGALAAHGRHAHAEAIIGRSGDREICHPHPPGVGVTDEKK